MWTEDQVRTEIELLRNMVRRPSSARGNYCIDLMINELEKVLEIHK